MNDFKFDKKCFQKKYDLQSYGFKKGLVKNIKKRNEQLKDFEDFNEGNFNIYFLLFVFSILILLLIFSIFKLQFLEGEKMYARSEGNQIHLISIPARRGMIFDRNGEKLVENRAVVDLFLNTRPYLNDDERLRRDARRLEEIVGDSWIRDVDFDSILGSDIEIEKIKIASDLENDTVILLKSLQEEFVGVVLEEGVSRNYLYKEYLAHILGYTSIVNFEDFDRLDYIGFNDIVGRTGIEKVYDEILFGQKGQMAIELDALGRVVSEQPYLVKDPQPGESLYLGIDLEAQKKAFDLLAEGVKEYGAESGTMIVQDVHSGEILVMASFPSFDSNLFVHGISQDDYDGLLSAKGNPLSNKAVGAQVPPGSTFKTLVALSALDAKKITKDTTFVSRRGYTFTGGHPFQEFRNNAYGSINLVDALMVSSNIYFCEVIRNWDIHELVPYFELFGIGKYTNIDIPGEMMGMLPSPENKVRLAKSTSPWLEPYWLPEGDSCNTVIGQGIITTTPIQVVNWTSAIANGGFLHIPRIVMDNDNEREKNENEKNKTQKKDLDFDQSDLDIVKLGMRESVSGSRNVIIPLSHLDIEVAAKTGTAEFGKLNPDGRYEQTHAWVSGFFPYSDPEFAFVVLLEDGGESNNAAEIVKQWLEFFIDGSNLMLLDR